MSLQQHAERHGHAEPCEDNGPAPAPAMAEAGGAATDDEAIYTRQGRYTGHSTGERSLGLTLTIAFHVVVFGAFLINWGVSYVQQEAQTLSVFDVAPPAAPPEPETEIPPGPEQVQREKPLPEPERPTIDPPEIQILSDNPVTLPDIKPVPDPGPPVELTTAPESKPAPPAAQVSDAKPTWEGRVLLALNKKKRYPSSAQRRREQGIPWIRFVMDREGKVLSVRLERSSGFRALDDEAVKLPGRAAPLPKPPDEVEGQTIELVVPVEFFIGAR
ncbi:energy transducer TonB [Novosphingobium beihaiensis]|uniref:Energy transducer TonB n=1 Tax=Novosphingobium beihaiensis TaxID=2930389 RepID=A0ABT0BUV1_9SPHN|nr:energy transducer TonB [Novosphingobium beihaiensis]MCJ2188824.1 energy transducer TonB [Novosphingobium beihaiensis]